MRGSDIAVMGLVSFLLLFAFTAIVFGSNYDRPANEPAILGGLLVHLEGRSTPTTKPTTPIAEENSPTEGSSPNDSPEPEEASTKETF